MFTVIKFSDLEPVKFSTYYIKALLMYVTSHTHFVLIKCVLILAMSRFIAKFAKISTCR